MHGSFTRSPRPLRAASVLASLALLAGLVAAPSATAAPRTWYVGPAGSGGGSCAHPDYNAIAGAVAVASSGDTVHICAWTYTLSATVNIPVDLAFVGDGPGVTIVDGASKYQIMYAYPGHAISLSGLTLRNGASSFYGGAIGGAILTVTNSWFFGNTGAYGGAIDATSLTVTNSVFSGNVGSDGGGAIYTGAGVATIANSTFSGNRAAVQDGGAIDGGTLTVTNSTFAGNSAPTGGAIAAFTLSVTNSTFSTNSATTGGAIQTYQGGVTNGTFSGNTAGTGGAIHTSGNAGATSLTNSVLAQSGATNNCAGVMLTDSGGNFSTDTSCGFIRATSHVVTIGALALGALGDNGGPTRTVALRAGSVAIDTGVDAVCGAAPVSGKDQRAVARPQGAHCDSGAYEATAGATYSSLSPARILDTRNGTGLAGVLHSGSARTFAVTGTGGVPANAIAVTGNVTVTNQTSPGFVSLTPSPNDNPATSTLNFPVGDNRANGVTVALAGTGTLSATYMGQAGSTATTDLIFDVTGYFVPSVSGARYAALTPARILDTRSGTGLSGTFASGTARTFTVTGRGGVPTGAIAVTGNLTVTNQTSEGFASLTPIATNDPATSTLNFPVGDIRANGVTVALSSAGTLSATYRGAAGPAATTDLIFDVTGYFITSAGGAVYVAVTPARILDSRNGTGLSGRFACAVARTFAVTGRGGIPAGASAVTGNVTVTNQSDPGFVALTLVPTSSPTTSTINFPVGDNRANGVTSGLSGTGTLSATYRGAPATATTDLIFDVTGYFRY